MRIVNFLNIALAPSTLTDASFTSIDFSSDFFFSRDKSLSFARMGDNSLSLPPVT